ncbi:MAG: Ig-like domain-containing protein [Myxococcota bacterium]
MNRLKNGALALLASSFAVLTACGEDATNNNGTGTGIGTGNDMGNGNGMAMVTGISVAPDTVTIDVGGTSQLTVTASLDDGSTQDVTSVAEYSSSDDAVALVTGGDVAGVAEGMATITATFMGFMDTVDVTVRPGGPIPFDPVVPVDGAFPGRAGFGESGANSHTEDDQCPMRSSAEAVGVCHRIVWDGSETFTGAFWLDGSGFGDNVAVNIAAGATAVRFSAWGAAGGERIEFGAGLENNMGGGVSDMGSVREFFVLGDAPTEYSIPLANLGDYTMSGGVAAGFIFAMGQVDLPTGGEIYIDDIRWVNDPLPMRDPPLLTLDDVFMDRSSFGGGFMEATDSCPMRSASDAFGDCHTITWDGNGGFTGAFWTNGAGFANIMLTTVDPGATVLKFSAWRTAESQDTAIEFGFGLGNNGDGGGADGVEIRRVFNVGEEPTEFQIPLGALGGYPNGVAAPFLFVLDTGATTLYIDDIRWEAIPEQTLPMTVDDAFPGRGGFSAAGAPAHTEDDQCPMRSSAEAVGTCHRVVYDGSQAFTGALWIDGEDFATAQVVPIQGGATLVKFSAWGAAGGENVEFGIGDNNLDGVQVRQAFTLTDTPVEYTLSVEPLGGAAGGLKAGFEFAAFSQVEFYIDDIRWTNDTPPPPPINVRLDPADAAIFFNGGNTEVQDTMAGGAPVGNAAAGSVYVAPFQLPEIPMGGFTEANFTTFINGVGGDAMPAINIDLYGLPFRSDPTVTPDQYFTGALDPNATLLGDDFLVPTVAPGAPAETDDPTDQAIVDYLNAQVTAGAVAGDFVFLRFSPDADSPIGPGRTYDVSAAINEIDPGNKPTLIVR